VNSDEPEPFADELRRIVEPVEGRPAFSSQAYEVLRAKVAEFISDLVTESARIARRGRADDISAAHVERAAEHLTSASRGRFYRHLGTVGGIMLGGALSNILSMTLENKYGAAGILITTGIAVIGAALVAGHIVND
jgi:histone H3/H4